MVLRVALGNATQVQGVYVVSSPELSKMSLSLACTLALHLFIFVLFIGCLPLYLSLFLSYLHLSPLSFKQRLSLRLCTLMIAFRHTDM